MLVLSRQRNERIFIGDPAAPSLVITVIDIRGDKVRLGLQAPPELPIHREEVAIAIAAEQATLSLKSKVAELAQALDVELPSSESTKGGNLQCRHQPLN